MVIQDNMSANRQLLKLLKLQWPPQWLGSCLQVSISSSGSSGFIQTSRPIKFSRLLAGGIIMTGGGPIHGKWNTYRGLFSESGVKATNVRAY